MKLRLILALAPAAAALAGIAYAQAPGAPAGGPPPGMHAMPGGDMMAHMKAMHEEMMKQHAEDLKTVLRLRPDQEPALQAFLAAHGPHMEMRHGPGGDGPDAMPGGPPKLMTTPQRLDEEAKHDAAMAAEHAKARDALAKFYAALSPDQQKVFDALERLEHGHGGGPQMMMMGGPGMMMMHGGPDGGGERRIIIRRQEGGPPPPPAHEHEHD